MVALLVGAIVSGCRGPDEPLVMKAIDIGRGADAEGKITDATRTFDPQSMVYASIATIGTAPAKIQLEWRSGGKSLATETRDVDPDGPARFVFHFVPPGGWPRGRAQVVFFTDERDKHAATFDIQ
jgi:hypothetical protein